MRQRRPSTPALLAGLGGLFALEFAALAVAPADRTTWVLENLLVVALVGGLAASYRAFRFSRLSYVFFFVFLSLHEVGAHYTYSLVPYDAAWNALTGSSLDATLGFQRNEFDRFMHLAYGLLFATPIREIFLRVAAVRGFWGYFLPLDLTMSTSMTYELIEWGAAAIFGGDVGQAYLGTQGDVWDAHKDMALASLGALLAMLATFATHRARGRDVAADWAESLRVKQPEPAGDPPKAEPHTRGGTA